MSLHRQVTKHSVWYLKPPKLLLLSHSAASDSAISWTVAHQAPLSMGFSR